MKCQSASRVKFHNEFEAGPLINNYDLIEKQHLRNLDLNSSVKRSLVREHDEDCNLLKHAAQSMPAKSREDIRGDATDLEGEILPRWICKQHYCSGPGSSKAD